MFDFLGYVTAYSTHDMMPEYRTLRLVLVILETRARAYSFGDDDRPPRAKAQGISLHSLAKLA
jgi:hypothetical protein